MHYIPYIEMGAFTFLLLVTLVFFIKEKLYTMQSTCYGVLLCLMLTTLGVEIAVLLAFADPNFLPVWANRLLNSLLLLLYASIAIYFVLYALVLSDSLHVIRFSRNKLSFLLLILPFAAYCGVLLLKPELIYYFDKNLRFRSGTLFGLLHVCGAFYMLCGIIVTIKYRAKLPRAQFYTALLFAVLVSASCVAQYFLKSVLIIGTVISLGLTCMFFTYQNPDNYVDELTKLLGRSGFLIIVGQLIKWRKKSKNIIIIDVNSFKTVNSLFGIIVGDGLILNIVNFLRQIAPNRQRVFRIGGDQFALIANTNEAAELIEQIRRRFKYSWNANDNRLHVSVSIAKIAVDQFKLTSEDLMGLIQNTIYLMKDSGRGGYIEVDDMIIDSITRRTAIENSLRNFEENGCLELIFQPIYSVKKKRITSAEVLLRMELEGFGQIPPEEFIKIAELSGMIARISRFVLIDTCRFISENGLWDYGLDMIDLNLSPAECLQDDLASQLKDILSGYPFDKSILSFEITETAAVTSNGQIPKIMETLSAMGVSFALDDYGQGYSNSDTLICFPFTTVKLGMDLLWSAFASEKASIIYRSTVEMLKELGMRIVSEGAETQEHVSMLHELGVDDIQGYYYGEPLDKTGYLTLLAEEKRRLADRGEALGAH